MANNKRYYEESLDLDLDNRELWEKNLVVLRDGKHPVNMTYRELFNGFDKIKAVTFSSSASFFDEITSGYKEGNIILGLPTADFKDNWKSLYKQAFKYRKKCFYDVNDTTRNRIADDMLQVRYGNKGLLIHDKFYILYKTGLTRLIIGSANMSKQAFSEEVSQAETISFYDNDNELIEFFEKRFESLKKQTSPFFPGKQIKHFKETGKLVPLKAEDNDEEDINTISVMPADLIAGIKGEVGSDAEQGKESEYYYKMLDKSISTGKKGNKKKSIEKVKDSVDKMQKPFEFESAAELIEKRPLIINNDEDRYLYQKPDEITKLADYEYTKDELVSGLQNIDDWISTYKSFERYSSEIGTRVMEIIMSCFNAVFFKDIRDHIAAEKTGADITKIPVVIFLAGQANSGKSILMSYIAKLLGQDQPIGYKALHKQNSRVYNLIDSAFESGNKMPMLIDEYDNKQLSNNNSGLNQSIKGWSNNVKSTTCLITSTNLEDFSTPEEIRRRTKFFMMSNIFYSNSCGDVSYEDVIDQADNTLFKIFAKKFIEAMENGAKLFENNKFNTDYLYNTRSIFKEMYKEAGIPIPDYLSDAVADDYDLVGRRTWKQLLERNKDDFKEGINDDGKKTLTLPSFILQQYYGVKDNNVQIYKNYLPNRCLDSEINSNLNIVLLQEPFFEWLGNNPFESEEVVEVKRGLFGFRKSRKQA